MALQTNHNRAARGREGRILTANDRAGKATLSSRLGLTHQAVELAKIVDGLRIDVFSFGILTDFRTRLSPGSARLVELADRMNVLQVEAREPADPVDSWVDVAYEVLCRQHHRRGLMSARARAVSLAAEPLPFG